MNSKEIYNSMIEAIEKMVKSPHYDFLDYVNRLVKISGINERDLRAVFSFITGKSIKSYVNERKMMEASRRRMMQAIPEADVVITNPTHYAVAIKYDPEVADAPIVIAKGENYLAQKIKAVAKEHQIEIVENKPLARMLYANVEVGGMVPPELYQAVAEVLAFVYHLKGKV